MNKPKNKRQNYRFVLKHHFRKKRLAAFHAQMLCALALWSGQTVGQEIPWHLGRIDDAQSAPSSINTAKELPGPHPVVVAVLDSGVVAIHPSLEGNLLPGYDMVSPEINLRKKRSSDFRPDNSETSDDQCKFGKFRMHGTEVASLIAGNGIEGVLGVNSSAKIVPVRVFGACAPSRTDLLDSISWAAGIPVEGVPENRNPARIINLSMSGGYGFCSADLQSLINRVVKKNIFIVTAAGNIHHRYLLEPSNCKGVISVGALDALNNITSYSALDPRIVLYAPGGGTSLDGHDHWSGNKIRVAGYRNNFFGQIQPASSQGVGTSFSAALVSGFISLWLSRFPEKTPQDFLKEIRNFSREVNPVSTCPSCSPRGLSGFTDLDKPTPNK